MTAVTTVTGLTADRMIEMENATVIDGDVVGDNLILKTRDDTEIDAGNVRGPQGIQGDPGTNGTNGTNGAGDWICTSTTRPASPTNGFSIYETDTGLRRTWTGTRWKCQERVICTVATRPAGFVAADEGVYAYCTDVNYGFTWDGTRWAIDKNVICTNATRPAGLTAADEGVLIYETDTDSVYYWLGTAWGNAFNRPAGILGPPQIRITNRTSTTTATSLFQGLQTLVIPANRQLKAHFNGNFAGNASAPPSVLKIFINIDGAATQYAGGLMFNEDFITVGTRMAINSTALLPLLTAGSHTFEIFGLTTGGNIQIVATAEGGDPGPMKFWIEDIGPNQ